MWLKVIASIALLAAITVGIGSFRESGNSSVPVTDIIVVPERPSDDVSLKSAAPQSAASADSATDITQTRPGTDSTESRLLAPEAGGSLQDFDAPEASSSGMVGQAPEYGVPQTGGFAPESGAPQTDGLGPEAGTPDIDGLAPEAVGPGVTGPAPEESTPTSR